MNKSKPHILVVAGPGQGHINSLLHLSHKLISHGFNIIFVNTDYAHQRILEASDDDWKNSPSDELSFVSLPDGLDLEDERKEFGKLSEAMVNTFPSKLEELITRFNSESDRGQITCVVADSVMSWTLEVALKLGIKRALHWPMAASFLLLQAKWSELLQNGIIDNNGIPLKREKIQLHPNIPLIDAMELPWYTCSTSNEDRRSIIKFSEKYMECLKLADWWLCNSIRELEPESFELLPNLHPIGPMISTSSLGGQMWVEDASCLSWLDEQKAKSVVFISFGSIAIFNLEQFQELALAVGALERPVLWVLRPGFTSTGMDSEFLDQFQGDNVKIVSWVPQLKVLRHPAISCFVSHCGWNSTMEGLANGVSFLCWPYYGDQFLNRSYICDVWKVGLGVEKNENGIVMRGEIRAKVERLLGDQGIRERALRFREVAMENIAENGNSSINFKNFIKWLKT